jgi:hypothetical protein
MKLAQTATELYLSWHRLFGLVLHGIGADSSCALLLLLLLPRAIKSVCRWPAAATSLPQRLQKLLLLLLTAVQAMAPALCLPNFPPAAAMAAALTMAAAMGAAACQRCQWQQH